MPERAPRVVQSRYRRESRLERPSTGAALALGLSLAAGLALGGWFVGHGLLVARSAERQVTVKGFAEREVVADLAMWPVAFTVTADDLVTLQQRISEGAGRIRDFLAPRFPPEEISLPVPQITDREAQQGYVPEGRRLERYAAQAAVILRTRRLEELRGAMEHSGELVSRGVALVRSYEYNTQYQFTGLESIKPEMIAEATLDARRAAEQFARDSGSRVGAIRTAQQGFFAVEDRDPFSPQVKKVRVVTTIQFFLVDD